jgi:hypothetical protein
MFAIYQMMGDEAISLSGYWLSGGNPILMVLYLAPRRSQRLVLAEVE